MKAKSGARTFFTVGGSRRASDGAFSQISFPNGNTARILDKAVFDRALSSADRTLGKIAGLSHEKARPPRR